MTQVLLCGAAIVTLSMGIRHGFGLWLQPVTMDRGWSRETFAFALAVQNLAWGIAGPIAGGLADRFGAFRVLLAGSLLYAGGLVLMGIDALLNIGTHALGGDALFIGAGLCWAVALTIVCILATSSKSWAADYDESVNGDL